MRDKACVYCGNPFVEFKFSVRSAESWDHIINDLQLNTRENIALCCRGRISSKGQKTLSSWFESDYCKSRGFTVETVAPVVKLAYESGA